MGGEGMDWGVRGMKSKLGKTYSELMLDPDKDGWIEAGLRKSRA